MASKAQIKASSKYNKENTIQLNIRLNKRTDEDIIRWLDKLTSGEKARYIKMLIRMDINTRIVFNKVQF